VAMNGPTLCIATTVPIAGSNGLAVTPTIYTVTLGSLSSAAYGVSFGGDSAGSTFSPNLTDTGTTPVNPAGIDTTTVTGGASASAPGAAPPPAPSSHPAARGLFATLTGGILSRRVVVTVALLAEMALLGTLWASWLLARSARRRAVDDSPTTRMDLI